MTAMLVAWVAFPLVMAVLSLGCGQAVQAATGGRIRGTLLLPTGFAAIVVIAQLATMSAGTAHLATSAVVTVAMAGGLLTLPWRRANTDRWPVLAALGSFAAFGAPVVLSGSATFTGWIKLDDGAQWLALTDRVMQHGRSVAGLPHSTYQVTLEVCLANGYPVGAFVPLGVGGQLLHEDLAWLIAPYVAFLAAMLALAVYSLSSRIVQSPALRALTAVVAAQAATLLGYALWGGIKEVLAAALIALVAALVPMLLDRDAAPRAAIPFGVATAATLGALTVGGALWLAPILVPALWLIFRAHGARFAGITAAWFAGVATVLAIPTLAITRDYQRVNSLNPEVLAGGTYLANLVRPLRFEQVLGIWPTGDFRVDPHNIGATYLLLAIAAASATTAIVVAVRRRRPELVLYVVSALAGAAAVTLFGSPWVAGKALATASPALVAAAMVGGAVLFKSRLQIAGLVALLAVAGGVIWSNVLQVHDVDLAPRAELAELSAIGTRFAGQGPALMTEYSPYGARHFLRQLDPESAGEFRWRLIPLRSGEGLRPRVGADIDEFQTDAVLVYRTLVLRRSATASRPPSVYHLVWKGHYYEVWQRSVVSADHIIEHLALGTPVDPAAVPRCDDVLRLARRAGPQGQLVTVGRTPTHVLDLSAAARPAGWAAYPGLSGTVAPSGAGTLRLVVNIPVPGRYGLWLGGAFRDRLDVVVDDTQVYSGRVGWTNWGVYSPIGEATLGRGPHSIVLGYHGPSLSPGSGGRQFSMGPLVLGLDTAPGSIEKVASADAASLCGRRLDWVEAVEP
jgi:hypothetical protein